MDNRIRVGIRVRPLSPKETAEGGDQQSVQYDVSRGRIAVNDNKKSAFGFDWVYGSQSSQQDVYDNMCKPLIDKCMEGYNATFFAYGQTGAGKTFTMGTAGDFQFGVMPFAVRDLFAKRELMQQAGGKVDIELSYVEIYMEECFDLLNRDGEKRRLDLRETSGGETYLEGTMAVPVQSMNDVANCLVIANRTRATAKTAMNNASSRSHALCTLTVRASLENSSFVSRLNLVDLAGSERAKKTQASGDTFQEGISINKGLLALGNVVAALCQKASASNSTTSNSHVHVPYRESKLTRLLKDSLGGNGWTVLLACVSPAQSNGDETLNTLRFASRASSIVNRARINEEVSLDPMALAKEVRELRDKLAVLQNQYDALTSVNSDLLRRRDSNGSSISTISGNEVDQSRRGSFNSQQPSIQSAHGQQQQQDSLLLGTHKLASSLRSLLTFCFENDSPVDEAVDGMQTDLSMVRACIGMPDKPSSSGGDDEDMMMMGMMPPIVVAIDELLQMENHLLRTMNTETEQDIQELQQELEKEEAMDQDLDMCKTRNAVDDSDSDASTVEPFAPMVRDVDSENEDAPKRARESNASTISSLSLQMDEIDNDDDELRQDEEAIVHGQPSEALVGSTSSTNESNHDDRRAQLLEQRESQRALLRSQAALAAKERRAHGIQSLSAACHAAISSLQLDIAQLQKETQSLESQSFQDDQLEDVAEDHSNLSADGDEELAAQDTETVDTVAIVNDSQVPSQPQELVKRKIGKTSARPPVRSSLLVSKRKELDDKVRLLKQREAEFRRLVETRHRLEKEVDCERERVRVCKVAQVQLTRKLKASEANQREQRKQLLQSDMQAKRVAQQCELQMKSMNANLENREKVWKVKLEAKERESHTLKETLERQREVARQRDLLRSKLRGHATGQVSTSGPVLGTSAAAGGESHAHGVLSFTERQQLQRVLQTHIDAQRRSEQLNVQLAQTVERRREWQRKRIAIKSQLRNQRSCTQSHLRLEAELALIDKQITCETALVNELQSSISSMDHQNNKQLNDVSRSRVTSSQLLAQCGDGVGELKALVGLLWSQHCKEMRTAETNAVLLQALQSEHGKAAHSTTNQQTKSIKDQGKSKQQRTAKNLSGEEEDRPLFDSEEEDQFEDDDDDDFESEVDLDETYYPSQEDDDDNDSEEEYIKKSKRKPTRTTKRSRATASAREVDSEQDMEVNVFGSEDEDIEDGRAYTKPVKSRSKRSRPSDELPLTEEMNLLREVASSSSSSSSSESDNESVSSNQPTRVAKQRTMRKGKDKGEEVDIDADLLAASHWNKSTVKELKKELALRNLAVSGVKGELVKRLVRFEMTHANVEPQSSLPTESVTEAKVDPEIFSLPVEHVAREALPQLATPGPFSAHHVVDENSRPVVKSEPLPFSSAAKAPLRVTLRGPLGEHANRIDEQHAVAHDLLF